MRNVKRNLAARFGPEVRFEVKPIQIRAAQTVELARLKERLLRESLAPLIDPERDHVLRRAADDAAALAWATGQPLLFFPVLFEEKARSAPSLVRRQKDIRRRSADLVMEAA